MTTTEACTPLSATETTITVVAVDDHPLLLDGVERLLSVEPDLRLLARCTSGDEALSAVRERRPRILLLDLNLPDQTGLDVLCEMQTRGYDSLAILLTASLTDAEALDAVRLGVRGIVRKDQAAAALVQCIHTVHAGGRWLDHKAVDRALDMLVRRGQEERRVTALLSNRELSVVRLLARGLRNKEIARELSITEATVKVHVHHVYEKLGMENRVALASWARELDLDR